MGIDFKKAHIPLAPLFIKAIVDANPEIFLKYR